MQQRDFVADADLLSMENGDEVAGDADKDEGMEVAGDPERRQ
jgi:hypothetical protein